MAEATTRTLSDIYDFDTTNGIITAKDEAVVEQIVRDDIKDAFGGEEVETDTTTPLGRMIEWLSLHFTNTLNVNVQNFNQLVLRAAAGQQLDAMADWFQTERKAATKTTVDAILSGTVGTSIPKGVQAQTVAGDIFVSVEDATIGSDGTCTVQFESYETGPISCPKNNLTIIDTPTVGWDSITNASDGTLGRDLETDDDLRLRIENDRAVGSGWLSGIKNAIEKVDGVNSSMVLENNSGDALDVHGVPMAPHSVFICIDGIKEDSATKTELANAVISTISSGTGYTQFEDTTKQVTLEGKDDYGHTYPVYVYKPESQPIIVDVIVKNRSYNGSDYASDVKQAIMTWAEESTLAIGESVYASDIIRAIEEKVPGLIVVNCMLSDGGIFKESSYVEIAGSAKGTFSTENISVSLFGY